jgi:hypothetical protein
MELKDFMYLETTIEIYRLIAHSIRVGKKENHLLVLIEILGNVIALLVDGLALLIL